jgi:hypothetical protein
MGAGRGMSGPQPKAVLQESSVGYSEQFDDNKKATNNGR